MSMDNPELYNASNGLPRAAATDVLNEYASRMKWGRSGDSVVDLGCGDGSVTGIIKSHVPPDCAKYVACDINEKMLEFAKRQSGDATITFRQLDAEGQVPEDMKECFDHLFSFLLLHWVHNQEKAYKFMYDLLSPGGDCLITFFTHHPTLYIYDYIARDKTMKWGDQWIKEMNKMVSVYLHMKYVEKYVTDIMKKIGFTNINVQRKKNIHSFKNALALKDITKSVQPFNMPDDVFDEFFEDYMKVGKQHGVLDASMDLDSTKELPFEYELIVVYACKPE